MPGSNDFLQKRQDTMIKSTYAGWIEEFRRIDAILREIQHFGGRMRVEAAQGRFKHAKTFLESLRKLYFEVEWFLLKSYAKEDQTYIKNLFKDIDKELALISGLRGRKYSVASAENLMDKFNELQSELFVARQASGTGLKFKGGDKLLTKMARLRGQLRAPKEEATEPEPEKTDGKTV